MQRPNIYKYLDYRIYLKDMFQYKKKTKKIFSYRFFAETAGFKSTAFIKFVIDGHRNLSNKSIAKIAKGFGLKKDERRFLENLAFMNQAKTNEEKNYYYKKMTAINGYMKINKIEKSCYEYFSNWYNLAIREIVIFGNKKYTAKEIAGFLEPEVPLKDVKKSLKLLQDLELIKINDDGCWEKQDKAITTGPPEMESLLLTNCHKEMLNLAIDSLDKHYTEERDITGLTISIKSKTLNEIKKRIASFRKEILEMACNEEGSDQVFQISIQAIPLTNKNSRWESKAQNEKVIT